MDTNNTTTNTTILQTKQHYDILDGLRGVSALSVVIFHFMEWAYTGATLTPNLKKICVFSGKISSPLYMTHYAVIWMFGNYYISHKPDTIHLTLIIIVGLILLVGAAYLVMVVYDIPVRKYFSNKRNERLAKKSALERANP